MGAADVAISYALAQRGKRYVFGATGPDTFDCSGLTMRAYQAAGINISRTTYTQVLVGTPVSKANLAPGDLVFPTPDHVQLYIGYGKVVQAPHTGTLVQVSNLGGVWQARRVTTPGNAVNAPLGSGTGGPTTGGTASPGGPGTATLDAATGGSGGTDLFGVGTAIQSISDRLATGGEAALEFAVGVVEIGAGLVLMFAGIAVLIAHTAGTSINPGRVKSTSQKIYITLRGPTKEEAKLAREEGRV